MECCHSLLLVSYSHATMKYFCITHRESKAREVDLPAPDLITNEWQTKTKSLHLQALLHP